ncbi:AAA family ATPase [Streptomyces sp. CA-278952]|uniref:AAA family ATPase n=1 Tax=unclassified Streptomyces TaxID=2593676 RepID=UPI002241982C|nr:MULTISPECIES: AAA family ATPase [unclassified Streptomyces]UZI31147.1 AAA family ATPase [Streptomyces sp. VB1]WDG31193.1 AAA family ATPase [Streptomyces sp. CA-278952]
MYVSRVRVENIKSFHGPRVVDLTLTRPDGSHAGWTVLAGRNGSGKTTLLRALALALSGPGAARSLMPDFDNWLARGTSVGRAQVSITRDTDYDRFTTGRPPRAGFVAGLTWRAQRGDASGPRAFFRRGSQPSLEEIRYTDAQSSTAQRGPWADNPVGWFCAGYGPFRRMAGGSGNVQRLMMASGPVARQASLFHEDASLAEGVTWLIDQHLRALEGRPGAVALKAAALAILKDGLLPDGYEIGDVDSDGLWVRRDGHWFPLSEMSDGFRTVAALVVDILKQIQDAFGDLTSEDVENETVINNAPGVVIIDEIDAHLHVSWQRRIGPWLTTHFPNIQFIVTTHSPYICQAADPGGLIRLPGVGEDALPEVVSEDLYERVVYGSGDDAVLSELFGLDTPYSEQAEHVRAEFMALESRVYEGDTSYETFERYMRLKDLLTSSPAARVEETSAQLRRIVQEIRDGEAGEAG